MIRKLYLELTSMCNLSCRTCFRNNWFDEKQGYMSDEILDRIYGFIRENAELETVMLAGMGEPLLHKRILDIVKTISSYEKRVEVLTNATLLNEAISKKLIAAGLDIIWVSFDDAHIDSANNTSNNVARKIDYFNSIRAKKCKLGFTFVVENNNTDAVNKIARRFNCDTINISGAIPCNPVDSIYTLSEDISYKNYCPFIEEHTCFIKWNGDVAPCMQLLHNSYTYLYKEKRKVTAYSFGNLLNSSLNQIWNSKQYIAFREKVKRFEFPDCTLCDGCDDRLENKTDCMFNDMPTCGACLWAQNIARCP